jgi:hypothetical protein
MRGRRMSAVVIATAMALGTTTAAGAAVSDRSGAVTQQHLFEAVVDQVQAPTAHDSGISLALRERGPVLGAVHDSGISLALRERDIGTG